MGERKGERPGFKRDRKKKRGGRKREREKKIKRQVR